MGMGNVLITRLQNEIKELLDMISAISNGELTKFVSMSLDALMNIVPKIIKTLMELVSADLKGLKGK